MVTGCTGRAGDTKKLARVAFAGLLAATVTIMVTIRFQATREHNPPAVSGDPSAAIEVSSAPKADFQTRSESPTTPQPVARDITAARLVLQRVAAAGNARAALLLGETCDGCLILRLNGNAAPSTARAWYEVAAEFGSTDARQRLYQLSSNESGGDPPNRR
jgi:hypothetical protein